MDSEQSTRNEGDGGPPKNNPDVMMSNSPNRNNGGESKRDSLSRLDTPFLRELATNLNGDYFGSYRDYSTHSRGDLLDLISDKLTVEEVRDVYSGYILCHTASDVANEIKPDSTNSILRAIDDELGSKDSVYEVKVGKRYCDIVFPESLTAIEVKSARDKVERSIGQISDYRLWAEGVFLAYDSCLEDKIPQQELEDLGAGLIRVSEGRVSVQKEPETLSNDVGDLLSSLTLDYLRELAKKHEISSTGNKDELTDRLESNISYEEVRTEFIEFVKERGASKI